jgi:coenzyme F420-reducing hydrogenase gamma subunit
MEFVIYPKFQNTVGCSGIGLTFLVHYDVIFDILNDYDVIENEINRS